MTSEKWNSLSVEERRKAVIACDPSMKEQRWAGLVESMVAVDFDRLTRVQQHLVMETLK